MSGNTFSVGQTLWWVSNNTARSQRPVTITKVGRTWLSLDNLHRVDRTTLIADSGGVGGPPGQCYPTQQAYEADIALTVAWHRLLKDIDATRYRRPAHLTHDAIDQIRSLLSIPA